MSAACGMNLNSKNMIPLPAACGIACETCWLKDKCGGCVSGIDPTAPEKLEYIKEATGAYCPALKCAIERKVEYCLSCDEFPCKVHYKWGIPYSKRILDLHKQFKEQLKEE